MTENQQQKREKPAKFSEKELKTTLKLIKAAKKLGVISMKIGQLEFVFENRNIETNQTLAPRRAFNPSKKEIIKIAEQTKDQSEFDLVKDDLAVMHVEDPQAFEQALIENDLEDSDELMREGIDGVQETRLIETQ